MPGLRRVGLAVLQAGLCAGLILGNISGRRRVRNSRNVLHQVFYVAVHCTFHCFQVPFDLYVMLFWSCLSVESFVLLSRWDVSRLRCYMMYLTMDFSYLS